ncbi:D-alanyl-D-alanine carboxypeptidase [Streptomyces sp. NPDC057116]|uniref:D-alanyl-D-alanine carboxypeptidase family protein n=1 Tax=Streptomyces sp. NPDC057116 TaxID=3346023 RepID=UPI003644B0BA
MKERAMAGGSPDADKATEEQPEAETTQVVPAPPPAANDVTRQLVTITAAAPSSPAPTTPDPAPETAPPAKPKEAAPAEPTPDEAVPEPTHDDTAPDEPTPADPTKPEPTSTEPTPADLTGPKPTNPEPTATDPTQPKPTEPTTEPEPATPEPSPAEPTPVPAVPARPTQPELTPTPPEPTSTAPTEPKPTEPTPTSPDHAVTSPAPADPRPAQASAEPPPPLELLAQLTNTPPPPDSPARTVARKVKIWSPIAVLLGLVLLTVQLVRPLPEPTFTLAENASSFTLPGDKLSIPWPEKGQGAVTVMGSGSIGTFGAEKPVPTASVAKIMTAYVILREHPLKKDEKGPRIAVDAQAVSEGSSENESRIEGLELGQTFTQQDMLKMLMIPSGNNIGRLLARWDTGSKDEAAFVRKMNDAAKALGMKNTTYTDPSGLDSKTVSTAVDQLKLAEAVMKSDAFRAIVAMPNADIPGVGRINNNNDRLLVAGLSVRGIKTGSNTPAGGTLSWAAYKTVDGKDRLILGTMMDQHAPPPDPNGANSLLLVQDNSKKVIEAVREALTSAPAVAKGQVVGHVDDGLGGRTPVVATQDLKAVGVPGQKLTLTFHGTATSLPRTAQAGTVIGHLTIGTGPGAPRVPVALRSELTEPSVTEKLTRLG